MREFLSLRKPNPEVLLSLVTATLGGVLALNTTHAWLVLPATAAIVLLILLFRSQALASLPTWPRILLFLFTVRPILDATGPAQQLTVRFPFQAVFATLAVAVLLASLFLQSSEAKGFALTDCILWALTAITILALFIGPLGDGFDNAVRTIFGWIVAFLIGRLFETKQKIETFCQVIFFSSVVMLTILCAYLDVGEMTSGAEQTLRLGGQFGVPNTLAGVAFVFFCYGFFVFDKLRSSWRKGAAAILLMLLTLVILRTQSKTVAIMAVIVTLTWVAGKKKWKLLVSAFVLLVIIAIVLPQVGVQSRVLSVIPSNDDANEELLTLTGRTILWSAQFQLFDDANALQKTFGVGWGTLSQNYRRWGFDETSVTENSYLWLLIGGGFLSLLLYFAFLAIVLYKAVYVLRRSEDQFQRSLALFSLIITMSLAIECSTNDILIAPVIAAYHFAIISMFLANSKIPRNREKNSAPETLAR